ncbi:hypothetical protein AXE80_02060 [Wenyingzhuangia fucanilytica]|uniref:Uncharacterized protein n=1 Tax=Wenyingzhuangia fucanilytica TaxID=1790137 RepID=A0A1B1Y2Z4_9FLAO|nr:hypothetical protein [Wenyingzhuangia fucanilytica]ANW95143.1 hypothetical protein AXE80_02060 [Wenyingzhuangia fucanilytica]
MKNILIVFILVMSSALYAQENAHLETDQNKNAQAAYEKYAKIADEYTLQQGTTAQETYVAIDPMEEKRIRKKIHKDHRAMRSLWRHEERMERAKNTQYVLSNPYRYSYNSVIGNPFYRGIGFGYFIGRSRF